MTKWEKMTPEQRKVHFGSAPSTRARHDAYQAEIIRRFKAGEYLTEADKKEARRILKTN